MVQDGTVEGEGFGLQGVGFRVQGRRVWVEVWGWVLGLGAEGSELRASGLWFMI